jgi:AraC-like DNA-binding protein
MPLERAGGQAQFIVHEVPTVKDKTAIGPLSLWIEKNLHKELSLPLIARQAAMSTRTLSRRFFERVGATPAQWVSAARVRRAQHLLETTSLSVEEVAAHSGFRSASVLREHFAGIVGTAPCRLPAKLRICLTALEIPLGFPWSVTHHGTIPFLLEKLPVGPSSGSNAKRPISTALFWRPWATSRNMMRRRVRESFRHRSVSSFISSTVAR